MELQDLILKIIPEFLSLVFLSATCKTLLALAEPYVTKRLTSATAPWMDCRLICLGRNCYYEDLPPTLLTAAEKELMAPRSAVAANEDEDEDEERRLYADTALKPLNGDEDADSQLVSPSYAIDYATWSVELQMRWLSSDKDSMRFKDVHIADMTRCKALVKVNYPTRDDWVVANLSKGEYVYATDIKQLNVPPEEKEESDLDDKTADKDVVDGTEAVGKDEESTSEEDDDTDETDWWFWGSKVTLGHVVLSRICWSSDPGVAMPYEGGIHQGVWAGDRFRITTLDRLPTPLCGGEWKDMSEDVCKELTEIWKANYW